jgi:hypothetical protein
MAALSLGFDELERRLELIRRRLNLYALQDALYRAGAAILGGAAAVLAVAAFAEGPIFGPVRLGYLALAAAATAYFALRVRRQWLSLAAVAALVDRKAGLDCRLSTMLAHRGSPVPSRLRGLLLAEVFLLASRWTLKGVAPRRVPRSVAVFGAALALLIATLVFAPNKPEGDGDTAASGGSEEFASLPQQGAGSSPAGVSLAPSQTRETGRDESRTGAGEHASAASRAAAGAGSAPGGAGRSGKALSQQAAQPASEGSDHATGGGANAAKNGSSAADAEAPRRDAGDGAGIKSPDKAAAPRSGTAQSRAHGNDAQAQQPSDDAKSEPRPGGNARRAGQGPQRASPRSANGQEDARQRAATAQQVARKRDERAPGGAGANRGESEGGTEKSGLYGAAGKNGSPTSDAAAMLIKLTAFSALAPQELEDQGKEGTTTAAAASDSDGDGDAPLAEQSEHEMPLLRAPLAVEHEAMLRDIFTRRP